MAFVRQELVCAGSVSGALLPALVGGQGTTAAQASQALFNQLAKDLLAGEQACHGFAELKVYSESCKQSRFFCVTHLNLHKPPASY